MLLQCTWKQVEPCGLREGRCCNRPAGVVLSWRLWVTAGAQRREKGHCGQCFPTCHPSLLCPVGMCALTTASWAPKSQRKSAVLLEYCCRLQAVMTCNHHSPAITGGSPYCQGDFHSRLWFPLWYHRGSELPVFISTGCAQRWRCKMTGTRICEILLRLLWFDCVFFFFSCFAWHTVLQFYKSQMIWCV